MDLNYILSRHQLSLVAAESAAGSEARAAHRGLANGYAARKLLGNSSENPDRGLAAPVRRDT